VVGAFLGMFAIKGASGALYNAVLAAQSLVVFLLTVGLSFFLPHILKEKIDRITILQKLAAIALIIGGIWLLK
jgi:NO-binding membrane sensor protein with MHYT domain